LLAQCRHELAHEERPAPGYAQAGVDDVRSRSPTELCLEELDDGGSRQRSETDHIGGGIGRQPREQLSICAHFVRAGRDYERDVQLFEPSEQERQVPHGRGVCPVRIVDHQEERARRGEVRAQPVEAVEDRKRGVDARRGLTIRRRSAREPEQVGRHTGSGLQQIGTLELRCLDQRRLEQLPHDPEGEVRLHLRRT
jgi:hypothetical protein